MNKTVYKQYDSRWGSKPYPTRSSSFSGNGCGCVACTHLIIENPKYAKLTPEPVRKWMVKQGFAISNQGTTYNGITKTLQHYGFKVVHIGISDPMSKAWKELNKGNRMGIILFLGGRAPNGTVWTAGGHYIAFTDYHMKNGKHYFYTKDSGGRDHDSIKYGYYSYENSMKGLIYQMWIVEKPQVSTVVVKPATTTTTTTTAAKTSTSTSTSNKLKEDGVFGKASVKAAQRIFGTKQTGKIGGQNAKLKQYHKGFKDNVNYGSGGSALVRAIQKYLDLNAPDGQLGPVTIKAIQKFLKLSNPDGIWGPNTSKAFQKWLNNNPTLPKKDSGVTKTKGIDISTWQGKISVDRFKKAKDYGVKFVILRVGFTRSSSKEICLDDVFEHNYKNAKKAGLKIGYYYYSCATSVSKAKKEAEFVLKHIKGKQCDMPVYIDVEDPSTQGKFSRTTLAEVCNAFCKLINAAGYKAGVYASTSWFTSKIGKITEPHTKWVAQYYKVCQYKGKYDMWQYSSSENVPGIAGNTDVNWYYKKK